jgi:hypothetical protein
MPTKPYKLIFEQRDDYLYAHVTAASIDEKNALKYLREIANRCETLETSRLMLYRNIPVMLPDGVLFLVTTNFLAMIKGIRTAFVNPYLSNADAMEFAMTVGNNRGGDYCTFNNIADAEEWLLK